MLEPTLPRLSVVKPLDTLTTKVAEPRQVSLRRWDILAYVGLVVTALLFVSPAIFQGFSFGPHDDLSTYPLTQGVTAVAHNFVSGDQLQQMIPWYYLDWTSVHHGALPLWNRFALLGMPQMFNFQSAPLSLPIVLSYLVPAKFAYLVIVIITLIIAGTGTYYFSRCLGLMPMYAFFAAITFQLGGSFVNWVGWPLATTASYLGWMLGATYMLMSTREHRRRHMTVLTVAVALDLYSGHPETTALLFIWGAIFFGILLFARYRRKESDFKTIRAFLGWESLGIIGGLFLALPLLLPGLQIIATTNRVGLQPYKPLPLSAMSGLMTQGFFGYPITGYTMFGPLNYYEIACYVGPLVLIFALYGLFHGRMQPEIQALAIAALAMIVLVFDFRIPAYIINHVPLLPNIPFTRGLMPLDFSLAILSGFGLQKAMKQIEAKQRDFVLIALSAGMALVFLAILALDGLHVNHLTPQHFLRDQGVFGALIMVCALGLCTWLAQGYWHVGGPIMRYGIPLLQLVFLLIAGVGINSYSKSFFPENADMRTVQNIVKGDLLGTINPYGPDTFGGNGYVPELNSAYGIREFAGYDPVLPTFYYQSYQQVSGKSTTKFPRLAPTVDNAALARTYGIRYVIGPASNKDLQIPGFSLVAQSTQYQLYEVSGSRTFTLDGVSDTDSAIQSVDWINNYTCEIHINSPLATQFIARIGNFPGWHATVNGAPVTIATWQTAMMQMPVPNGESVITLTYWPERLTFGFWLAGITLLAFVGWWIFALTHHFIRQRQQKLASAPSTMN